MKGNGRHGTHERTTAMAAVAAAFSALLRSSAPASPEEYCLSGVNVSIISSGAASRRSGFHGIVPQNGIIMVAKFSSRRPPKLLHSNRNGVAGPVAALPAALLFDCDGVLVDTERDGHRVSFNEAFSERGLNVTWDVDLYGKLLKIGGGKERMTAYFNETGWPDIAPNAEDERKEFVASLHKRKTELFMALIEKRLLPLRPGVGRLIDEALTKGVTVAVCSTSNEKAVSAIVQCLLGPQRAEVISIFAGDIVPRKKPDPAIYQLAATTFGVEASRCIVIEDSAIGLAAAKSAGMKCIVTKSGYTAEEDFTGADAVFDFIGDPPNQRFDLNFCGNLLEKQYVN